MQAAVRPSIVINLDSLRLAVGDRITHVQSGVLSRLAPVACTCSRFQFALNKPPPGAGSYFGQPDHQRAQNF